VTGQYMQYTVKANPAVVFRQEFDDWAILFNPASNEAYGISPVASFIWQHLDGKHTCSDILALLRVKCTDIPSDAAERIATFAISLVEKGFASRENG